MSSGDPVTANSFGLDVVSRTRYRSIISCTPTCPVQRGPAYITPTPSKPANARDLPRGPMAIPMCAASPSDRRLQPHAIAEGLRRDGDFHDVPLRRFAWRPPILEIVGTP